MLITEYLKKTLLNRVFRNRLLFIYILLVLWKRLQNYLTLVIFRKCFSIDIYTVFAENSYKLLLWKRFRNHVTLTTMQITMKACFHWISILLIVCQDVSAFITKVCNCFLQIQCKLQMKIFSENDECKIIL